MNPLEPVHELPWNARALCDRYREVRAHSLVLADSLSAEDQCVQSMADASPTKWHLAHTTWFFETMVLQPHGPGYTYFDPRFAYLFNSYYEALGPRHPRPQRGLLTRPSLDAVHAYRRHVDAAVLDVLERGAHRNASDAWESVRTLVTLGLHHEQQHQELILTDILHVFASNPLLPAYRHLSAPALRLAGEAPAQKWIEQLGGVVDIGHEGPGFGFDNETPRHRVLLAPYRIADRLVTCGEYAQFIADGGYQQPQWWLSDGWAMVQSQGWRHPLYWLAPDDPRRMQQSGTSHGEGWQVLGLHGLRAMAPQEPVSQLSFYEATAYAEWAGARLPTEFEWEAAFNAPGITQMDGHVWQWTRSAYSPYPGFRPLAGMAGEYNGKFMVGQMVLRGSSVATPAGHARASYRNFFPPGARWQFSGLRLAKDHDASSMA